MVNSGGLSSCNGGVAPCEKGVELDCLPPPSSVQQEWFPAFVPRDLALFHRGDVVSRKFHPGLGTPAVGMGVEGKAVQTDEEGRGVTDSAPDGGGVRQRPQS